MKNKSINRFLKMWLLFLVLGMVAGFYVLSATNLTPRKLFLPWIAWMVLSGVASWLIIAITGEGD